MRSKLYPIAIAAGLVSLSLMSACKKDTEATRMDMFVGTWKTTEDGRDANNNGSWDASERQAITGADIAVVKFSGDGTGSSTVTDLGVPAVLPFSWSLQNGDADIRVIFNIGSSPDTSVEKILILNSTDLELMDSRTPRNFTAFKKQ
jgi:hypothetical protein